MQVQSFWQDKRVTVTGGGGFLGRYLLAEFANQPHRRLYSVRSRDYNLTEQAAVRRLFQEQPTDVLLHLAAAVGGIGFNREHPGRLFYENLMMGAMLIEEARRAGVGKIVVLGTICAY